MLGVNDLTNQGVIRLIINGKPAVGDEGAPVLLELPESLGAADVVKQNCEVSDASLRRLYRATGSLGSARPRASTSNRNTLWLAKSPKPNGGDWDVTDLEAVILEIASMAGIRVPEHRVIAAKDLEERSRTVLLTHCFDYVFAPSVERIERLPYISVMAALETRDEDDGSWLDLAEFARRAGGNIIELWRGAMFGAATGNTDSRLQNHGYLRKNNSQQLIPAFDMNPEPFDPSLPDPHQMSLLSDTRVDIDKLISDEGLSLFGVSRECADHWLPTPQLALS